MDDPVIERAQAYASRRDLQLAERLGFGVHGIVYVAVNKVKAMNSAVKVHRERVPFFRELAAYTRLAEHAITNILGFNVPRLLNADDRMLAMEMTIVARPFLLDFAGAYLDARPGFSEEVWQTWEAERREQFADRWPLVEEVLEALEKHDIYLLDVSPSNIGFRD